MQRRRYGWLGAAGFAVALVGFTLIITGSAGEFWLFYDLPYGQPNGRDTSWTLFLLGHTVLAVGTLLFGIATVRTKVFAEDAATLFAFLGVIVPFIGAFVFAFPFGWLGYLLYSGNYRRTQQTSRVS